MPQRPNFLWIILDDVSPTLPAYGLRGIDTPHIDRVASEGCVYENAFATASVCSTSRNSLITARYHTANGAHHARTRLADIRPPAGVVSYAACPPPYVKAFTEHLRADGYFCSNNSKTDYQLGDPSSIWDTCGAAAHWSQRGPEQPFFAVFNPLNTNENKLWPENKLPEAPADAHFEVPDFLPNTSTVRKSLAAHYQQIETADKVVGKLLTELEWEDLLENTFVFITSDHGMGMPRFKRSLYDTGTRVPLIIRAPGLIDPGSRSDSLISLVDLGTTVLALAGIEKPAHMHGLVFIGERSDNQRKYVFSAQDRIDESYQHLRSVRDERYHYIRNAYPDHDRISWNSMANYHPVARELAALAAQDKLTDKQLYFSPGRSVPEELYDTVNDPWETKNLVEDSRYSDDLSRLRSQLSAWQLHCDPWREIPEAEMISQWWYEGEQPETAAPEAIGLGHEAIGSQRLEKQSAWDGPICVQLTCPTQGASIEYQVLPLTGAQLWTLYAGPIPLGKGQFVVRARAIRYGYKPSEEVSWKIKTETGSPLAR